MLTQEFENPSPPESIVVLAGGLGTRLRQYLPDVPKALAPIGDVPFICHLVRAWYLKGFRHFVFALGYQAEMVVAALEKYKPNAPGAVFDYSVEMAQLGTGGAIGLAARNFSLMDDILVVNGDTWVDVDRIEFSKISPLIYCLKVENASRFGSIDTCGGFVSGFFEKTPRAGSSLINAGIYRLAAEELSNFNCEQVFSLEHDYLPELVKARRLSFDVIEDSVFIDIGIPADYENFISYFKSERVL